jgi:hypothetical protein
MNHNLYPKPNNEDDWSNVLSVVVVYPPPAKREDMVAWYHGRLHSNPKHCIVEDAKGQIHVVSKDIVWHTR